MGTKKRLIDANELLKDARQCRAILASLADIVDIEILVTDQPTVDAVEVVRCEDCRYYDPDGEYCGLWGGVRHPEHYCGEGDPKNATD